MRWPVRPCVMTRMGLLLTGCIIYCFWQYITGKMIATHGAWRPLLLVVSFDGFRWDYLDLVKEAGRKTPVFDSLIANGVKAKWVKNSYVTLTFPNHYSIATGLYEENHGVVSNRMYDPVFNETFDGTGGQLADSKWWNNGSGTWGGEPVWLTNQQKSGHHSGVFFWAGSEAAIRGQHARYYERYNWSVPYTRRVDTMVKWFTRDQDPANFGMLYFEDPDFTGHKLGPGSLEMIERILELDEILGYVIDSIKEHNLFSDMNLVVTSDHGMSQIQDTVYLDDYIPRNISYSAYGRPPVLQLLPGHEDQLMELYHSLHKVPHVHVYLKDDIPKSYHYYYNRRILDITVEAEEGYLVCKNRPSCAEQSKNKGDHGYNNSLASMHPIFVAHGPAFKQGYVSEPFDIVDIYPLMCYILGVQPHLHDGHFDAIKHILADDGLGGFALSHNKWASVTAFTIVGVLLLLTATYFIVKYGVPSPFWRQEEHPLHMTTESQSLLLKQMSEDMV